jgi:mannosyltransferase
MGLLAPAALVLLAASVRLPTLREQSFWLDEAYTVRLLHLSLGAMLRALPHSESTPPVYYLLAWIWSRAFGYSEAALRALSALAGIATAPAAYAAARRLGGSRAGALAGVLVALSPFMVWFSQEARAYALAALLATITVWCLIGFLQTGESRWLWGWAISAALGLATHYFVAFVVAPELVWLARPEPRRDRRLLGAMAAAVAVGIGLVPLAIAQQGTGHADYIAAGGLGTRLLQVPKQLLVGYASPGQALTAGLAALGLVLGAGVPLLFDRRARTRALVPLSIGLVCVLVPAALAVVGVDFLNTRNLLPALPILLIAGGVALAGAASRARALAWSGAVAATFLAVVVLVDANPRYQRSNWRGASRLLGVPSRARALVVTPASGVVALSPYQPRLEPLTRPASVSEIDVVELPPQVTGGGVAAPARATAAFQAPAGFMPTAASYTSTYAVVRLTARRPVRVSATSLVHTALGTAGFDVLLQEPAR